MRRWERWIAGLLGIVVGGAGGYATFFTANQAGSAVLVIVAGVFLLISVQGTRLITLGGNAGNATFEQRLMEQLDEARRADEPAATRHIMEFVSRVDPNVVPRWNVGLFYERQLQDVVSRLGVGVVRETPAPDLGFDFQVDLPDNRCATIEAKYRHSGRLAMRDIQHLINSDSKLPGGSLIVTNAPLSAELMEYNRTTSAKRAVEVVTWNDERDNDLLHRALLRVAR